MRNKYATNNNSPRYPYTRADGWVVFEAPSEGKVVVGIDPSTSGRCPGTMVLAHGYNGVPTCQRAMSAAGSVVADFDAPFDIGSVTVDVTCVRGCCCCRCCCC